MLSAIVVVFLVVLGTVTGANAYVAHLSGGQAIPPVTTHAQGTAIFELSADGRILGYSLVVSGVRDVTRVQIRLCTNGDNGYAVVSLSGGSMLGVNTRGIITPADLTGPLKGRPLSALINSIQSGAAYVTVSTAKNPPGEVRGQIR